MRTAVRIANASTAGQSHIRQPRHIYDSQGQIHIYDSQDQNQAHIRQSRPEHGTYTTVKALAFSSKSLQPLGSKAAKQEVACRNVKRFRGGLVYKAHRLCVSLNSRLESNKEEEVSAMSTSVCG